MAGPTRLVQHPRIELLLVTGLLGAFTTFSTFSLETVILFQRGDFAAATLNVVLSLAVGLGAVVCGGMVARALARIF
jgi:CrcB protein